MAQIEGKTWDQLDRAYIVGRSDALGFLAPRHLAAVLPVYLCAVVEDSVWSPATGMLTLVLARPVGGKNRARDVARFDGIVESLTDAQCTAVAGVLRDLAEKDCGGSLGRAAHDAVEGHWKSYLPVGA